MACNCLRAHAPIANSWTGEDRHSSTGRQAPQEQTVRTASDVATRAHGRIQIDDWDLSRRHHDLPRGKTRRERELSVDRHSSVDYLPRGLSSRYVRTYRGDLVELQYLLIVWRYWLAGDRIGATRDCCLEVDEAARFARVGCFGRCHQLCEVESVHDTTVQQTCSC